MTDLTYDEHNARLIEQCKPIIELHLSGLITDYELLDKLQELASHALIPNANTLDRNTGLKYTPTTVLWYIKEKQEAFSFDASAPLAPFRAPRSLAIVKGAK